MTITRWLVYIPTFINVICAFIYMFAPRRHRHSWSKWDQWIISQNLTYAQAMRYRHCRDCSKVQRQETGYHACLSMKACPHLDHLMGSDITRLEKELGLDK